MDIFTGEFTIDEYQTFIAVMNKEAKRRKFKNIRGINQDNIVSKIIDKVIQKNK